MAVDDDNDRWTTRPLMTVVPSLEGRLRMVPLGELPTPVESLAPLVEALGCSGVEAWIKRDDQTSPIYGGNKVRTLEVLFGQALDRGATHIISTGAYGSNHAVATLLHAPRANLKGGAMLFPQPHSAAAVDNLRVTLGEHAVLYPLPHWSTLPLGIVWSRLALALRGQRPTIMVPGGATPLGALGYVSAAFELAMQIEEGALPAPAQVVIGVGSTCTSAGLLVGLHHAARLGIGFRSVPQLISVRVTPWPVTARGRIAWLAHRTSRLLARLAEDPVWQVPWRTLRAALTVDGRFLGPGYGKETRSGREAIALFEAHAGVTLDTTYSGKSAAGLVERIRRRASGPLLYWATKSTAPLPEVSQERLERAPTQMRRWMRR
ncbi:MAG: pyridoxal-phosphate dependent enzyme [Myxococcota bacterium]